MGEVTSVDSNSGKMGGKKTQNSAFYQVATE